MKKVFSDSKLTIITKTRTGQDKEFVEKFKEKGISGTWRLLKRKV